MTDRRRASGQSGQSGQGDNPYAPPPADAPDQPWQPRQPLNQDGDDKAGEGSDDSDGEQSARSKWGSQWSSRQPRRGSGGFGNGSQNGNGNGEGGKGPDKGGNRMRWDPKDPAQRHARYALLSGMWSFFFALFNIPPVALLLGALALYWAISSLSGAPWVNGGKGKSATEDGPRTPAVPDAPNGAGGKNRSQTSAAVIGLVVGSLGLLVVLSTFTLQLVYKQYYDCVEDSLTTSSRSACEQHLPEQFRSILGED